MQEHIFFPAPSLTHLLCYPDFIGGYGDHPAHAVDRPARSGDLQLDRLYNLHIVRSGKGTVTFGGRAFQLGAGSGFLYGPGTAQRYASDFAEPWDIRWIHFSCAVADRLLGNRGLGEVWMFGLPEETRVHECMERLLTLGRASDFGKEAETSALLYELLVNLVHEASPLALPRDPSIPGIHAAADRIRGQCTDPELSIAEIAASSGYSTPYFSRKFHQLMGRTASVYLLEARVLRAKQLLMSTDLTVKDIALASGFSQSSYFIQCFRKAEKMTPEQFRTSRRA